MEFIEDRLTEEPAISTYRWVICIGAGLDAVGLVDAVGVAGAGVGPVPAVDLQVLFVREQLRKHRYDARISNRAVQSMRD